METYLESSLGCLWPQCPWPWVLGWSAAAECLKINCYYCIIIVPSWSRTEVPSLHFVSEENRLQHRDKYNLEMSKLCSCLGAPASVLNLYIAGAQHFIGSYNGRIIPTGGAEQARQALFPSFTALCWTASSTISLYSCQEVSLQQPGVLAASKQVSTSFWFF